MAMTLDGSNGVTFNDASLQGAAASPFGLKNRIINGAMAIFQRGTAATTDLTYSVDRWKFVKSNDASESVSQNTDAPTGFSYSLRNTISTGDATIGAAQYSGFEQSIEGYNMADLAWGTANAKTVTLSFWVRSSVIGTYTGNLRNSNDTRINPFNFTINVANTWEQKTITITGDTGGTWQTTTSTGIIFAVYAALGSSYTAGTSGTWGTTPAFGCGSPVNGIASNGNIFSISGVQLEVGSTATPFERRLYGQELANCQRYYNKWSGANCPTIGIAQAVATGSNAPVARRFSWANPVDFRAQPTMGYGGSLQIYTAGLSNLVFTGYNGTTSNKNIISFDANSTSSGTSGQSVMLIIDSASAANYFDASAEL
jgi:hypothetical protein